MEFLGNGVEHAVDKARALGSGEFAREAQGFGDNHLGRIFPGSEFMGGQTQDIPIYQRQAG